MKIVGIFLSIVFALSAYAQSSLSAPAKILTMPSSETFYPLSAKAEEREGAATVTTCLADDSSIVSVVLAGSSGHRDLDEAAVALGKQGKYSAGRGLNGLAAPSCVSFRVKFSIDHGLYEGELKDGKRDGAGVVRYADGRRDEGVFKNNKLNGLGKVTLSDGSVFIGNFQDDILNGMGEFSAPSGVRYVGEFRNYLFNGRGTLTRPEGVKYVGDWSDGKRHGKGEFTSPQFTYVGEYREDKAHGFGTNVWPSGIKYVGEFKDDKRDGQGTFTTSDGMKYVGEFKDDKRNGQGTNTWPDGERYVGEYKYDKRNGQGTNTWPNGERYVGEWKDDKANGQGIQYNSDGSVKDSGMWSDDRLSQSFAIDTARFPFGAGSSPDVKDPTSRESNKKTSVEIVNDCLRKGLKPGTPQFSKCIAGQ